METVTVVCPHCDRSYRIKIDTTRLARVRTRAGCQRCGRSFDVASSIRPGASSSPTPVTGGVTEIGRRALHTQDALAATQRIVPDPALLAATSPSSSSPSASEFPDRPGAEPSIAQPYPSIAQPYPSRQITLAPAPDPAAGWIDFIAVGVEPPPMAPIETVELLARLLAPPSR